MPSFPLRFSGRVVRGAGRGKQIGVPTLNIDVRDVPSHLPHGIYACRITMEERNIRNLPAAVHYGPRPVFQDDIAFEIHLLDTALDAAPASLEVEVIAHLREVRDFPDADALKVQIDDDVRRTRELLS